jgi:hypothetical protein
LLYCRPLLFLFVVSEEWFILLWLVILSTIAVSVCCIKQGVVPAFLGIGHNVDRYCLMLNRPVVGIVWLTIYYYCLYFYLQTIDGKEGTLLFL